MDSSFFSKISKVCAFQACLCLRLVGRRRCRLASLYCIANALFVVFVVLIISQLIILVIMTNVIKLFSATVTITKL